MSTRCNILIGDSQFYHHHDGYPQGVGADLAYWLADRRAKLANRSAEYCEKMLAGELADGIPGRLARTTWGKDDGYESEAADGLHSDIEFLYIVKVNGGLAPHLYCVDVWKYLEEHPAKGGNWNHPLFRYKPSTYRKMFCRPEYEIPLPGTDVPPEEQLYCVSDIVDRDEAVRLGMDPGTNVGYGDFVGITKDGRFLGYRFIRVRNAKPKKPRAPAWRKKGAKR